MEREHLAGWRRHFDEGVTPRGAAAAAAAAAVTVEGKDVHTRGVGPVLGQHLRRRLVQTRQQRRVRGVARPHLGTSISSAATATTKTTNSTLSFPLKRGVIHRTSASICAAHEAKDETRAAAAADHGGV